MDLWHCDTSVTPEKYYVELFRDRSSRSLLDIIKRVVSEGSIIFSDELRRYKNLNMPLSYHDTVNHSYNFVNTVYIVHPQNIESLWNKLKKRLKIQNGTSFNSLKLNLREWMWKDNICKNDINKIFELLNL
ncbi:hypothetical protein DMUE_4775 [Dictyocoela muelleri]|nr:hypothetical protein DMUE_4775 [Dictyocoela muelleri]